SNAASHLATNKQWLSESEQKLSQAELAWNEALQASKFEDESSYLNSRVTDDELQVWQKEIDNFKQTQTKLEQTLHDLNHALKAHERPDLDLLNDSLTTLQAQYIEVRNQLDTTRSTFERIEKVRKDIATLHEKNSKLEE
ncbi:SMC family ATPase, partial [Vibrio diabolicus]